MEYPRQAAPAQRLGKIEFIAQLHGRQRIKVVDERATRQQIRPAALEFARAGTRENEFYSVRFDERMHHVEQARHLLHFVEDDPFRPGGFE
jgi:hypothetical protein